MRVHRLELRTYRGVADCRLTFADRGVTVVEGGNEAGKSSAAEALHLLLECRDDSTRKEVVAVRPLHLDAGAEVEAELSIGEVRFTYRKRWHRGCQTELRITEPTLEIVHGREAHDRVRGLLAQAVDLDLWRSLSRPQGEGLDQQPLRDHASLVAALDAAAGGELGTADESDLLHLAEEEAARWWTPTGRARPALTTAIERAEIATAAVAAARTALESLEADVRWCADLEHQLGGLQVKLGLAETSVATAAGALAVAKERTAEVDALAGAAALARSEATIAARAVGDRAEAIAAAGHARDLAAAAHAQATATALAAAGAEAEAAAAAEALLPLEAALAQATAALAAAGTEHRRLVTADATARMADQLAVTERQLDEVRRLATAADSAAEALAACTTSPAALAELQVAHDAAVAAGAALAAVRGTVVVEALVDLTVQLDGVATPVAAGSSTTVDAGELVVVVPGAARVTLSAGQKVVDLERAATRASTDLTDRCAALGVSDLAGAHVAEAARCRLVEVVAARRRAVTDRLGGRRLADLEALVADARELLGDVDPATVVAVPPGAVDDALADRDEAQVAQRTAERSADRATARHDATIGAARTATAAARRAEAEVARLLADAQQRGDALAAAREAAGDDEVERLAAEAAARAEAADAATAAARGALDPAELPTAGAALQRVTVERDGLRRSALRTGEELAGIRARLELQGEGGLHDRLADAERDQEAANAERTAVEARSAAARRLVDTLRRHRDDAARAYGGPLQRELEALGRLVFGPTFAVELDDDLRIRTRTLDGIVVPWAQLSVGAREQLGILARLATAAIVSPGGGVPVLFDDVLGYADPDRVVRMAAAFEAAADRCQIIVLTCDPARYAQLARARTHRLGAPTEVASRENGSRDGVARDGVSREGGRPAVGPSIEREAG